MASWVYVFSRFTPEALLFESLVIFFLAAGYAAFWVLKKRKLGAIQQEVPATVVKGYLNELIMDAEQLRAQLFGLLSSVGMSPVAASAHGHASTMMTANLNASGGASDPELSKKFTTLELKVLEQSRAMENLLSEKNRLEKDLADAKAVTAAASAGAGAPGAGNPADSMTIAKLNEKIKSLESKLGEYSVIEDDLANLKRLQQENAQLRSALSGKVGAIAASPAAPAAEAAAASPVPATTPAPAAEAPALAEPAVSADPAFEGLVTQVEESLQPVLAEPATSEPALASPATSEPEVTGAAAGTQEKSDADLVAEFEKMLNG